MDTGGSISPSSGQHGRGQQLAARPGPVAVAANGIDLAVVGQQRKGWARAQLGRVLVEKRWWKTAAEVFMPVGQVRIERGQVFRHDHALVADGVGRQAGNIKARAGAGFDFAQAPGQVQGTLIAGRVHVAGGIDKHLLDARPIVARALAAGFRIDRHFTPAGHIQPLFDQVTLEQGALVPGSCPGRGERRSCRR
jgi:hypothetical protein